MRVGQSFAGLALVFVALGMSCTDPAVLAELMALGEGCLIDSDCDADLVCVFRTCHYQCVETKDCLGKPGAPEGVLCVKGEKPTNVCQLEGEQPCQVSPDCPGDQICAVDERCRDHCTVAAECVSPQVCVSGSCAEESELVNGLLVSTSADGEGQPCSYNSDCQGALICKNGSCAFECKATKDCAYGLVCTDNLCVPPGQGGNGGAAEGGGGAGAGGQGGNLPVGFGDPCNLQSDCLPYGLVCGLGGQCVWQCNGDIDCPVLGSCCASHACAIGPVCNGGGGDGGASGGGGAGGDGGAGGGTIGSPCSTNFDCDDGVWCNGAEDCLASYCVPAADTPCDSHSSCVIDSCAEPVAPALVGACVHQPLAGQEDLDGDGYIAIACTGGSDCDDTLATGMLINPDEPELCDAIDNNCNGLVDDHATGPRGPTVGVGVGGSWGESTPAVVPWSVGPDHLLVAVETGGNLRLGTVDDQGAVVIPSADTGQSFMALQGDELALAIGPGHALVGGVDSTYPHYVQASVISIAGNSIDLTPPTLLESEDNFGWAASAAWAGSSYVFAYRRGTAGHYALVAPDGSLASPIIDIASGLGGPVYGSPLAVAANAGTVLVAYNRTDGGGIDATVVRPNGGNPFPAATISLPVSSPNYGAFWRFEIAPVGNGFVLAGGWPGYPMGVTYFEVNALNQVINQQVLPIPAPTGVPHIASDGAGLSMMLDDGQDVDLYFWRPDLPNPVELSSSLFGPQGAACDARVAGTGGRLNAWCPQGGNASAVTWRKLGCL